MYEILQVLDMAASYPNALLVCTLWYEGEDLPKVENHHLGKIRLHILHCVESYVMHIPPLCS